MKKIFMLIMCAALMNIFLACGAQKEEVSQEMSKNFLTDTVRLNSGYDMPRLGFGTWTLNDTAAADCVYHALSVGCRLIDTARYYGNEVGVGRGIRKAVDDGICTREEIFITSKIMPGSGDSEIDNSLRDLNLDYVDLMLIHQSGYGDEASYKALERAVKAGKVRSIGISNYYTPRDFDRIKNIATIIPAVIQNENHPYYHNEKLQSYVAQFGTVIESWYPLGGRGHTKEIFNNATIQRLAKKYSKTPAQIVLRWQFQAGYIAIPGSKNKNHITENFNIFDFSLTAEDMELMRGLNKNRRFETW